MLDRADGRALGIAQHGAQARIDNLVPLGWIRFRPSGRSVRMKTMPLSAGAGNRRSVTGAPEWTPTPVHCVLPKRVRCSSRATGGIVVVLARVGKRTRLGDETTRTPIGRNWLGGSEPRTGRRNNNGRQAKPAKELNA